MPFVYRSKTDEQLRNSFTTRVREGNNGFEDFEDFIDWYHGQNLECHYCGLTEIESQEIVMEGILTSRRFPQDGNNGRGTSRGVWLEVDRINPEGSYSRDNCVMCCYFCNNDKSDVFDGAQYARFFQSRVEFLRSLLNENRLND